MVAQGKRIAIASNQWQDKDSTITQLPFETGASGTYVVGVSTKARNIALTAENFNSYLEHDGVLDILEQRTKDGSLAEDAVESYEKHVKAIYQVGDTKTADWSTTLGYPIEFVPLSNPYESYSGEKLEVQLLLEGKPVSNQLVYADHLHNHDKSHEHGHSHSHDGGEHAHDHKHDDGSHGHSHDTRKEDTHTHTSGQQLSTNDNGIVVVDLPEDGTYYLRTIYMTKVTDNDSLTHRSKWATLTFGVTHKHGADTHTHDGDHDHDHGHNYWTWIFVVGSLVIIGILFLLFRK